MPTTGASSLLGYTQAKLGSQKSRHIGGSKGLVVGKLLQCGRD